MIQVPPSPDWLRIQLLNYLWILHAWPSQSRRKSKTILQEK
jgi:hypothetical protein